MFLNSLNATRSYHESGHFIRFFGHDGVTEIAFKIDATALSAASDHEIEKLAVSRSLREKSTAWHKRFIRMGRCCSTL